MHWPRPKKTPAAAKAAEDETAVLQAQIDELTKKLADAQKTNP